MANSYNFFSWWWVSTNKIRSHGAMYTVAAMSHLSWPHDTRSQFQCKRFTADDPLNFSIAIFLSKHSAGIQSRLFRLFL